MTTAPLGVLWTPWGKGFTRRSSPVALRAPSDQRRRLASYTTPRDAAPDNEAAIGHAHAVSQEFGADVEPLALRSAGHSNGEVVRAAKHPSDVDTFDVIGDAAADDVWDTETAEALTQVYEDSDPVTASEPVHAFAPLMRPTLDAEYDDVTAGIETAFVEESQVALDSEPVSSEIAAGPVEEMASIAMAAGQSRVNDFQAREEDRAWLDQRLSEIALRFEQSLAEMSPENSIALLNERFTVLEEHLAAALQDVATRADVEGLRTVESHIAELAQHIENAESQFGRLDTIEQQLMMVVEQLADQRLQGPSEAAPAPDFQGLADSTAEQVAARLAMTLQSRQSSGDNDELAELLRSFIDDRRQSDEQTYTLLDTVQQAIIRVLDRIDALEEARAEVPPPVPPSFGGFRPAMAASASEGLAMAAADVPSQPAMRPAMTEMAMSAPTRVELETSAMAASAQDTDAAAETGAAGRSGIDKLRADFIADAQRAKLKAAAEKAEAQASAPGASNVSAPAKAEPRRKPAAVQTEKSSAADEVGKRPSRKLVLAAIALALVVAAGGGSLLLGKKKTAAPVMEPPAAMLPQTTQPFSIEGAAEPSEAAPANDGTPSAPPEKDRSSWVAPPQSNPDRAVETGAAEPVSGSRSGMAFDTGSVSRVPALAPATRQAAGRAGTEIDGVILQHSGREPTARELSHLKSQQEAARLSTELGVSAARVGPIGLMPEAVARAEATAAAQVDEISANDETRIENAPLVAAAYQPAEATPATPEPAGAMSGISNAAGGLSLPPATVGPLSLRLAAGQGDPSAEFEVGARLAEGKGTDQNFKEAHRWYQRAASQGFAQAQYRLGTLYERGLGVKKDLARAREWYERAAEQGNVKAMHNLAVLSAGRETQAPDYALAAQWFQSAAEYGLADSQFNLAVLRENGLGVAKDLKIAYKWYWLAAKGGDKEAARRRDQLQAGLPQRDVADAEAAAKEFRSKRLDKIVNDARAAGEDWKKRQAAQDDR